MRRGMAENKYKQLFQEISLQKEPRNGEGAPGRKVSVNGRFAFFLILEKLAACLHGYGNNLVEMKN